MPRQLLTRNEPWDAALDCLERDVDVAWTFRGAVHYVHSANWGKSFSAPASVWPRTRGDEPDYVSAARGPGGILVVAWDDWGMVEDYVRIRVSTDRGRTFGQQHTIAGAAMPKVGATAQVLYLAYSRSQGGTAVRRSLDAGRSWSAASTLSRSGGWPSDVEVAGSAVYVAFADPAGPARNPWADSRAVYRRSFDSGVTWSDKLMISPELHHRSMGAQLVLLPDGVGAFYTACRDAECRTGVFYRESADGRHWTVPEMVGPASGYSEARGIAYSGSVLVAYTVEPPDIESPGYSLWGYIRKAAP